MLTFSLLTERVLERSKGGREGEEGDWERRREGERNEERERGTIDLLTIYYTMNTC